MKCRKCKTELPDDACYCLKCGAKQQLSQRPKSRGNGQGSAYQLRNKSWVAVRTLGYRTDEDGKTHRITRSKGGFRTKKEALDYLPKIGEKAPKKSPTFKALYDAWRPTHRAGESTMGCYSAAIKYFQPVWYDKLEDIEIDDLQACMDDCEKGKRTRQNMKAVCGLMYKYAIPRGLAALNLAQYLIVGEGADSDKAGLPLDALEKLMQISGTHTGAAYAVCQCYLGFRPSELLALTVGAYNPTERAFVGGAKTDAGRGRTVTVSPKIQPIIDGLVDRPSGSAVFCGPDGGQMSIKSYRAIFYEALELAGIDNPITVKGGVSVHRYTPHSCRHTFATLMKSVNAPGADKLKLIGHTTDAQLRYYQDTDFESLRAITDKI
jgi:integrase